MTRILIADDSPQNIYLLEALLKGCGYEVSSVGNGADALDLARKTPPDLIITDILMPGMDGFELCRNFKTDAQLRHIPFIFYTAHYTDPKDEQFALSLGADQYITKPQQPELLRQIVGEVLEEHAQGTITSPVKPPVEDEAVLQQYSEVLFRQLEKKVSQLELEIVERKRVENQLEERLREIKELKQRLEMENVYLQQEVKLLVDHTEFVGQSSVVKSILARAEQVAPTDSTVLILGETGTGKELLARATHKMSNRKDRPLITVNCASLPPTLFESELFGREKGAYTGAMTRMAGRFELADRSTLFLDEIGEVPHEVQSKLLRVLEEGRFERLGSTKSLHVDVRIIAATNRDLAQDVKEGKFRKDLYYRLNVFPILIPPLRERPEDIPLLVWAFIREFERKLGKRIDGISKKSMEALQRHPWPGNVRELRNVIENAMILNTGKSLVVSMPGLASFDAQPASRLDDVERRHIMRVLERTGWRIAGKGGAADVLGLKRTTLQSLMKRLRISRSNR